jgi:hypothetical protein
MGFTFLVLARTVATGRVAFALGLVATSVLILALEASPARASTTFTVDRDDDSAASACTSASDDCSLRGAISKANTTAGADSIDFASGITTVTLTIAGTGDNNNASGDLDITDDLTINGGPSGVIIKGGAGWNERVIDIIGATVAGNSTDVTISDATIRGGNAQPGSPQSNLGGGIDVNGSADAANVAVANGSSLTLQRSTVTNNTATGSGGGIYDQFRSTIKLVDSTVSANIAGNGVNGDGGGVHSTGSLSLTNSTVTGNQAAGLGGGLSILGVGKAKITDSTINGNSVVAPSSFTNGGGIYALTSGTVKLTRSTVSSNTAQSSTDGNGAGQGGGIYADGGTMTLTNTTVSSNTAQNGSQLDADGDGGGIYPLGNAALTLANATIANNKAGNAGTGGSGGGIFGAPGASSITLHNTIVDANKADIAANLAASPTSQGHNLLGENPGSGLQKTDIVNKHPLLGPLQDNGGPTQTQALLSGSPAIDKGSNTSCPPTDQRGKARPKDGDGNGKAVCDIGSFEKQKP